MTDTITAIECTVTAPTSGNEILLAAWVVGAFAAVVIYALYKS